MKTSGKCIKYGDNVDTDVIIPARYLNTSDAKELAKHCMEDINENFSEKVKSANIMVAGSNFGCGSSREHAPVSIKASGVECVVAKSFARIFFRNSINIGLPILECEDADKIEENDELEINFTQGEIVNKTKNEKYQVASFPEFMQNLIEEGGLMAYMKKEVSKGE